MTQSEQPDKAPDASPESTIDKKKEIISLLDQICDCQIRISIQSIEQINRLDSSVDISDKYIDLYKKQLEELNNILSSDIDLLADLVDDVKDNK